LVAAVAAVAEEEVDIVAEQRADLGYTGVVAVVAGVVVGIHIEQGDRRAHPSQSLQEGQFS
jgi:hypothetical protein